MALKQTARELLERVLGRYDYRLQPAMTPPRGLLAAAKLLRSRGFHPKTVLDIGVGQGTPWLYESFPDARFELFEALDVFVPGMERICKTINAGYHLTALGSEKGTANIDVNTSIPTSSTMAGYSSELSILKSQKPTVERKTIPVERLDAFGPFTGPVLMKLDVEGYEASVIRGAAETLRNTDVIISEVSVVQRHTGDLSFGEYIQLLESCGFALIEIAEMTTLRSNGPLAYLDGIFVRSDSALRR